MDAFLKEYLTILRFEKNLSDNTVNSYRSDIEIFLNYLKDNSISDLSSVSYQDCDEDSLDYCAWC